jgi:hypothetical protein
LSYARSAVTLAPAVLTGLLPVTETRVDGLALLDRERQAGEPLEALEPEQVRAGSALQDSVDLVLGTRA